jgi:parvulin-like peptidyl-prolyl isomerase
LSLGYHQRVSFLLPLLLIAAAPAQGTLLDFVAASVNDDAIAESDVRKAMAVSPIRPQSGETPQAYRTRILDALIDESLQYDDAVRFGTSPPDAADVEEAMKKLRARLAAEGKDPNAEFAAARMTVEEVRTSLERQLVVQRYLMDRIRPLAAAEDHSKEEYEKYYVPERQASHLPVPPFEEVADLMRQRSQQRVFDEEADKWAKELRDKARVTIYKVPTGPPSDRTPVPLKK